MSCDLKDEGNIVWLEDRTQHRYVRVIWAFTHRRRGRICVPKHHRLIGYAELKADTPSATPYCFWRRYFYINDGDPYKDGAAPCEAVDPLTLVPGEPGKMTERGWGGPLPWQEPSLAHTP